MGRPVSYWGVQWLAGVKELGVIVAQMRVEAGGTDVATVTAFSLDPG